jgi:DNA-binding NarL/FixJ family response regulator
MSSLVDMRYVLADSHDSVHPPSVYRGLRLAIILDSPDHESQADASPLDDRASHAGADPRKSLATILADDGLAPRAGVLPLSRIGELGRNPPAVIVLATDLAHPAGLAAVRSVRRELPSARIVVTGRDVRGGLARQALNAGADAFVSEQDAPEALAAAARAVVAGLVCAPRATRRLVAKPTFSHREKQILELVVAGMTNRQIAGRLYLAESTVKSHVAAAFGKLGVRSRKDAAAILLDPAEDLAPTALPRRRRASSR